MPEAVIAPLRAIRGLARAVVTMLWVSIALAGLSAGAFANRISVVSDIQAVGYAEPGAARDSDDYVRVTSIALLSASLVILTLLIIWMWRVAKNAERLGRTDPRWAPGWTIGGWFVPVANLAIPASVMIDLWKSSDPAVQPADPAWRKSPRSPFIIAWWVAWLAASLLRLAVRPGDQNSLQYANQLKSSDTADLIAMVLTMIAGFLLIHVVRGITDRQAALAESAASSTPIPRAPELLP